MKIPRLATGYSLIYQPAGDTFAGPDAVNLRAGQYYADWIPNDHTFIRARDGRWHAFGITGPASPIVHEAELQAFHIVSPAASLRDSLTPGSWTDAPKVLTPAVRPGERNELWAPFVVEFDNLYHMFYGPLELRRAVSTDLFHWQPQGPVFTQEGHARDPHISRINGLWHMVYVAGTGVWLRTSPDLIHWSPEPREIFRRPPPADPIVHPGDPESPLLIEHEGGFYLFYTVFDNTHGLYDNRTFVLFSEDPTDFHQAPELTMLLAHAPELIRQEDEWYISSVEWPTRGISLARLEWV